jgi:ubiquinone/menaquinone biosynthesis C-methylase UbiE
MSGHQSKHHREPSEDRLFFFEQQEIVVADLAGRTKDDRDVPGHILDIGGGGEGIIGIWGGEKVVAIDLSREELKEAPAGPLKIVMDARELQFLDDTFGIVTAFFSFMYLKGQSDYEKVLAEVFRVLRPGGSFFIWDVVVPPRGDKEKDIFVIPLRVKVKGQEIETGYGHMWPDGTHDLPFYRALAQDSGFQVVTQTQQGRTLFLQLRKPVPFEAGA